MTKPRYVALAATADVAALRIARFEGRDHVVVPVVALIGDSVIHASTSETPELVPATEIRLSVPGWNGEPVVGNHPNIDGEAVAANTPAVLDMLSFGRVFNARFEDNRLKLDAYLDPLKAEKVGRDATRVLERALNGEPIEVSVGAFVTTRKQKGVANGREYSGVWSSIVPDHLAMLPEGVKGACSNEMGCGAPRLASEAKEDSKMSEKKSLRERIRALFSEERPTVATDADASDAALRGKIWDKLYDAEAAFMGIVGVFSESNEIVYECGVGGELQMYRRNYTVGEDGTVTLGEAREPVEAVVSFEAVKTATEGCGCKQAQACECQKETPPATVVAEAQETDKSANGAEGEATMDPKIVERVKALIASKFNALSEADEAKLCEMPESALAALEAADKVQADKATEPKVEAKAEDGKPKVEISVEELATLRAMAAETETRKKLEHASLVAKLKDCQKVYTEQELQALSSEQLRKILALAAPEEQSVDYSAAVPVTRQASDNEVPKPIDLAKRIRERAMKQSA